MLLIAVALPDSAPEPLRDFLSQVAPEWDVDPIGPEVLIAPDGCRVEQDGRCPHGHVSPLLVEGVV